MSLFFIKTTLLFLLLNPNMGGEIKCHSENSGDYNIKTLSDIQSDIRKKAGAEFQKSHQNSFVLNGCDVFTSVSEKRFAPTVYEEGFTEIDNPCNVYRMRITQDDEGYIVFAVFIKESDKIENYHAAFDPDGKMLEEDPWGNSEGYSIKIFDLYNKYYKIYSTKVNNIPIN